MNGPILKLFFPLILTLGNSLAVPQGNIQPQSPAVQDNIQADLPLSMRSSIILKKPDPTSGGAHPRSLSEYAPVESVDIRLPRDVHSSESTDLQLSYLFSTIHTIALEFYKTSFSTFTQTTFADEGYPDWVWSRFGEIKGNSQAHREFWMSAIASSGAEALEPDINGTSFQFRHSNIHAFFDHSLAIENTATSCYIGALQRLVDKGYLTLAAAILGETSKHAAWINSAVKQGAAWNAQFETSISPSQCLTVLSSILSNSRRVFTPAYMAHLPPDTKIHPPLQLSSQIIPGQETRIVFDETSIRSDSKTFLYGIFLHGPETILARVTKRDNQTNAPGGYFVQVPSSLQGACFFYLQKSHTEDITKFTLDAEEDVVAGPTMMMFESGRGREAVKSLN